MGKIEDKGRKQRKVKTKQDKTKLEGGDNRKERLD